MVRPGSVTLLGTMVLILDSSSEYNALARVV